MDLRVGPTSLLSVGTCDRLQPFWFGLNGVYGIKAYAEGISGGIVPILSRGMGFFRVSWAPFFLVNQEIPNTLPASSVAPDLSIEQRSSMTIKTARAESCYQSTFNWPNWEWKGSSQVSGLGRDSPKSWCERGPGTGDHAMWLVAPCTMVMVSGGHLCG